MGFEGSLTVILLSSQVNGVFYRYSVKWHSLRGMLVNSSKTQFKYIFYFA